MNKLIDFFRKKKEIMATGKVDDEHCDCAVEINSQPVFYRNKKHRDQIIEQQMKQMRAIAEKRLKEYHGVNYHESMLDEIEFYFEYYDFY